MNNNISAEQEAYELVCKTGISNLQLEEIISKECYFSYSYAKFIKDRFILGELIISKDIYYSYLYARNVLNYRFELGEKAISKNHECSYLYALDVIKGRFKMWERQIDLNKTLYSKDYSHAYCCKVMNYNHE